MRASPGPPEVVFESEADEHSEWPGRTRRATSTALIVAPGRVMVAWLTDTEYMFSIVGLRQYP